MEIKKLKRELKQSISPEDYRILKQALVQMCRDKTNPGSVQTETVRTHSLHFENGFKQPEEKKVERFAVRYTGEDRESIRLIKKSRQKGLLLERSACISRLDCEKILAGDLESLNGTEDPLLFEFYANLQSQKLKPKRLVDCTKETFVLGQGTCISIESGFSSGSNVFDFLNEKHPTIERSGQIFLKVQYEKYLPELVSRLLAKPGEMQNTQLIPVHA